MNFTKPLGAARAPVWPLLFAATAVLLTAADTYVVVLALPNMITDLGISLDKLQQAAPIVSGFLLGYIVVLPLLGRLSDHFGRRPIFLWCLLLFAVGSTFTATAHDLTLAVVGRVLQGLGGGGLVPVTLALVADMWPVGKRGVPLGMVGAVQELGAVVGPLYGAAIIAASGWRTIFWINVPLALLLGLALRLSWRSSRYRPDGESLAALPPAEPPEEPGVANAPDRSALRWGRWPDVPGMVLLLCGGVAGLLALAAPEQVVNDFTLGALYVPWLADSRWSALTTPLVVIAFAAMLAFLAWETVAPRSVRALLPLRRAGGFFGAVDWWGGALLAGALGAVVVVFAAADPAHQLVSDQAPVWLPVAAVLGVLFVLRERRVTNPLIPFAALRRPAAVGSLLVNLAAGVALIAVLIGVPFFARTTTFPNSQVAAALVLVRFLAAVPVGAVLGGWMSDRRPAWLVAATGMVLSGITLLLLSRWPSDALSAVGLFHTPVRASDVELAVCGLGFGLAIAPVNSAVLRAVRASLHGLASSLVVVARMVGMLVGLSVLTALGLRAFYASERNIPSVFSLCPHHPASCPQYDTLTSGAIVDEMHVIFLGAAVAALAAAALAAWLLRHLDTVPADTAAG